MTRLSPQQARLWFADRRKQGFNAAIVSLIGASANGAPSDDGATFEQLPALVAGPHYGALPAHGRGASPRRQLPALVAGPHCGTIAASTSAQGNGKVA
jgi:hypothetical protein